ncbi:MAG: chorismate-binding protein [Cytophagales bacterium]
MIKKIETKDIFYKKLRGLLNLAKAECYSLAAWKSPHEDTIHVIVCKKPSKFETNFISQKLEGFCFVPFETSETHKTLWFAKEYYLNSEGTDQETNFKINLELVPSKTEEFKIKPISKVNNSTYSDLVSVALPLLKNNLLKKVVLAQKQDYELISCDEVALFENLCSSTKGFCNLVYTPEHEIQIGASPEILVSEENHIFKTIALAGTQKAENISDINAATWTHKEIEEQALVSRYIIECFKKIRLREYDDIGPKTVQAGNLLHLKTEFFVNTVEVNFPNLTSTMLELLHPTSAICGMPLEFAKQFIKNHENFERGYFCGYLGSVNIDQKTNIYVNIRCLHIKNKMVSFFAGAGITEDSIPEKEFAETNNKIAFLKNRFSIQ